MCFIRYILVLVSVSSYVQIDWHFSGQNIALSRPTYQEPRTSHDGVPSRAVDNNTNTNWSGGSCTHTQASLRSAFWNVSFEKLYNISGIRIYNRNGFEYHLRNFKVFGVHENGTVTELYDDAQYDQYSKEVIPIELTGRQAYIGIKITIPRSNANTHLTLCEVQVYAVKCKRFRSQNNTIVIPNKEFYEENATVIITCNQGHERYPNYSTVSCEAEGWNRQASLCKPITCNLPKMPNNGYYITDRNKGGVADNASVIYFNNTITGKCYTGYKNYNENLIRVCQGDKTWSGEEITCKIITCLFPRPFSNGRYILDTFNTTYPDTIDYGIILNVTCDTGYVLSGEYQRKCSENHTWTGTEPVCSIVTCEYPGNILNGYYSAISVTDNKSVPYTHGDLDYLSELLVNCATGHYLNSGSESRQCLESGIWSGDSPVCTSIMCEWPLHLEGGYYEPSNNATPEGLPYDTVLTAFCFEMYNLSDNYEPMRCNEQHSWDKTPAVCEMIEEEETAADDTVLIGGLSAVLVIVLAAAALLLLYFQRYHKGCGGKQYINFSKTKNQANPDNNTDVNNLENDGNHVNAAKALRREQEEPVYKTTMFEQSTDDYTTLADIELSDQTYCSLSAERDKIPETAIYVEDLAEFILSGDKAKEKLEKQFEILPNGLIEEHSIALKPQNEGKNRYKNVYAYDASRVVLDTCDSTESDYINACYVHPKVSAQRLTKPGRTLTFTTFQLLLVLEDRRWLNSIASVLPDIVYNLQYYSGRGFNQRQKYIASQGPTKEILIDFWRMVWQSNSSTIVMLTNLVEGKKVKCKQYWPDTGSCTYGRVTVMMKTCERLPQFVVRTLTVRKDNLAKREIMQFHFTAWPDKGVPKYSSSLIQFLHKANKSQLQRKGPIIVHCSAGVGRTGIYIALDCLMEQAKALGYVDVVSSLKALRKQRVNLVQSLDQYMFLHHALAESFMLSTKAIPASEFSQTFSKLLQVEKDKGKSKLALEFETLRKMSHVFDEQVMNRRKSNYLNTMQVEEFTPILSAVNGSDNCSFPSAVFLPSYKDKRYFIVTQTPVEDTRAHFWRMIWEYGIHTIVMMDNRKETTVQREYWPKRGMSVGFENIMVTIKCSEDMNEHHVKTLSVQNKDVVRQLKQFQCGGWQLHKTLPDSPHVILSLMELVQTWQQQIGNHAILVHCMNGVNKSGLYCVISSVIERMKVEQDVAISHVIDEMRNACGHIIPSAEQYQFCHEAALAYIQQYDK